MRTDSATVRNYENICFSSLGAFVNQIQRKQASKEVAGSQLAALRRARTGLPRMEAVPRPPSRQAEGSRTSDRTDREYHTDRWSVLHNQRLHVIMCVRCQPSLQGPHERTEIRFALGMDVPCCTQATAIPARNERILGCQVASRRPHVVSVLMLLCGVVRVVPFTAGHRDCC